MAYVRFALLCLIWGSSFLLMKRAGEALSPWMIGAGRVLTGMLTLLIVARWHGSRPGRGLTRSQLPALGGVMLLGYAIPYAVQPLFIAKTGSSALAAMGVGFTPLFTLALSVPILGIRPTFSQTIGVLGALACLALLLIDSLHRSLTWLDLAFMFATPLMYALANIWLRMSLSDLPPLELTTICLGVSGLILLPLACVLPNPVAWQTSQLTTSLICLLVLGVFGTGLGMLMFNHLVQQQGPLFAAMITNLVPIGAVFLGWFDAERVTSLQLAALVGVLCCVAVVQWGAATAK